jgi:hypothetical protein
MKIQLLPVSARIVVSLCATLVVLSTPFEVQARAPRGGDTFQQGCRSLQDRADALLQEAKDIGERPNEPGAQEEFAAIIAELRQIGDLWNSSGCRTVFGDIFIQLPPRPTPKPGQPVQTPPANGGVLK